MGKLDLIRGLYEYNEWANGHVLDAAGRLSEEEFSRAQGASFDSVEGNLAHIMGAQVNWLARWMTGVNAAGVMELEEIRGFAAVRPAFDQSHAELRSFVESLTEGRLIAPLAYRDSEETAYEYALWKMMLHVANHGTHHRGETAMALTAMGKPPRQLDYLYFERERR